MSFNMYSTTISRIVTQVVGPSKKNEDVELLVGSQRDWPIKQLITPNIGIESKRM